MQEKLSGREFVCELRVFNEMKCLESRVLAERCLLVSIRFFVPVPKHPESSSSDDMDNIFKFSRTRPIWKMSANFFFCADSNSFIILDIRVFPVLPLPRACKGTKMTPAFPFSIFSEQKSLCKKDFF